MSQLGTGVQNNPTGLKTAQAKYVITAFTFKGRHEKLTIVVHVNQNMYNFVISRCCFADDGKEMYSLNVLIGDVLVAVAVVVC